MHPVKNGGITRSTGNGLLTFRSAIDPGLGSEGLFTLPGLGGAPELFARDGTVLADRTVAGVSDLFAADNGSLVAEVTTDGFGDTLIVRDAMGVERVVLTAGDASGIEGRLFTSLFALGVSDESSAGVLGFLNGGQFPGDAFNPYGLFLADTDGDLSPVLSLGDSYGGFNIARILTDRAQSFNNTNQFAFSVQVRDAMTNCVFRGDPATCTDSIRPPIPI